VLAVYVGTVNTANRPTFTWNRFDSSRQPVGTVGGAIYFNSYGNNNTEALIKIDPGQFTGDGFLQFTGVISCA
jgi:hypothetical protein